METGGVKRRGGKPNRGGGKFNRGTTTPGRGRGGRGGGKAAGATSSGATAKPTTAGVTDATGPRGPRVRAGAAVEMSATNQDLVHSLLINLREVQDYISFLFLFLFSSINQ
jgi:hypothetical protein